MDVVVAMAAARRRQWLRLPPLLSGALPLGLRDLLPASKIKSLLWHYKRCQHPAALKDMNL